uniref:cytochrome c heme attachment protein n=1 Tax=Fossombronia foveolata TaxID=56918 RepID=UPI00257E988C|nr:cytochrome c heme attachment protein [Fossombronia foveolata]WIA67259.1 cytochrome c heme attachment protein [Fossombronia foveolata]
MISTNLERILAHTSSYLLFLATLICWGRHVYTNNKTLNILGKIGVITSFLCITGFLLTRWILSKHFPLSNLYESSIFLSWNLTLIELLLGGRNRNSQSNTITIPSAMLAHGFATLGLPMEMQESAPLVPALKSHWLMMHVTMMISSYATLLCGSLLATAPLIVTATKRGNFTSVRYYISSFMNSLSEGYVETSNIFLYDSEERLPFVNFRKWQLIRKLDNWSYRIISLGFPFLTMGILSGAVWANEAWGSYWNWDPKETWALITWLIFAIYLHTRMIRGWRGEESAIIASLGSFIIWIRYSGVNLLGKGLHSYGWLI